jgi:hypothetical protein
MTTPDRERAAAEARIEPFDLARQEARIERALGTALAALIETGDALAIIRDQRLYRRGWGTFEDYCQDRWEMRREQADTLIRTAVTAHAIEATGLPLPGSQRALLALAPVADDPETLTDVWGRALEDSPRPSARAVTALLRPESDPTKRNAFGDEDTGPDYGGYAAELADPEGWRGLAAALLADDTRPRVTLRIPPLEDGQPPWRALAREFTRSAVEGDASIARMVDIVMEEYRREGRSVGAEFFAELDHDFAEANVRFDADRMVDRVWEVEDFTFEAWPVFTEFWATAHTEGWFDVRGYVTDRIVNSGAETWAVQRAARIVAALPEEDVEE